MLTAATKAAKNLNPFDQLVIVSQEDNAEARLGNLIAQQETLQQQLAFATQVESAKIIVPAPRRQGIGALAPQFAPRRRADRADPRRDRGDRRRRPPRLPPPDHAARGPNRPTSSCTPSPARMNSAGSAT